MNDEMKIFYIFPILIFIIFIAFFIIPSFIESANFMQCNLDFEDKNCELLKCKAEASQTISRTTMYDNQYRNCLLEKELISRGVSI